MSIKPKDIFSFLAIVGTLLLVSFIMIDEGNIKSKQMSNSDKIHTIKSNKLTVSIKTKGAELTSIKTDALEYLWQANPEYWARQSPILFPIVGRLKDHEYTFQGKTYPMKQHGFARNNDFEVVEKTDKSITFEQVTTDKSKAIYPFDFVLQIKYSVLANTLNTEYMVKNPSNKEDLYFSIGAHPAFNLPFESKQKRSDYQLVFDKAISPKGQINNKGLNEGETYTVFSEKGIIEITDTLFDKDSFAFNPNPFSKVTIVHKPTQKEYMSVVFKGFPYLGIWSKRNVAPFVCIEPWYGIADKQDHDKDYTNKEGVNKLAAGEIFNCSFRIEVFE